MRRTKRILRFLVKFGKVILIIILAILVLAKSIKIHSLKKEVERDKQIISYYEQTYLNNGVGITYQSLEEKVNVFMNQNTSLQEELSAKYDEINQLQTELREVNGTNEFLKQELDLSQGELEQQSIQNVEDTTYLSIKFPSDGNYYFDINNTVFYSDVTCTKKLSGQIRFISKTVDYSTAENGLNIFCLRMDNGEVCYCTLNPNLVTENEYWKQYN